MAENKRLASFSKFSATMSYESLTGMFETDAVHQLIRFVPSNGMDPTYLHYADILEADTIYHETAKGYGEPDDESTVVKSDEKGELPYFSEFYLYIMLSDPDKPNVRIPFIFQKTLKDSVLGKRAMEDSYVIKRWVRGAMKEPQIETAFETEDELRQQELELRARSTWTCPKCSYVNRGIKSICMSCGLSRNAAIEEEGGYADINYGRLLVPFSKFETTRSCETLTGIFEVDAVHQLVRFTPNNGTQPQLCHFRDIFDVEVIQKKQTVTTEEFEFETRDYLVEFYLYVMLNIPDRDSLKIPFIFQKTLKDSVLGRRTVSDSNTVKRWLRDAMHEQDRETAFASQEEIGEYQKALDDEHGWTCPVCSWRNSGIKSRCISCSYNSVSGDFGRITNK